MAGNDQLYEHWLFSPLDLGREDPDLHLLQVILEIKFDLISRWEQLVPNAVTNIL